MEGMDYISDSYSMEIIIGLIAERMWSKVASYLDDKKKDERMDDFGERISKMEGYQKAKH